MQRHRVRQAADVAGHDRHGAKLPHRPRVAEDDAVQQTPLDIGQRHPPERLPATRAEHDRGLLFIRALRLHQRDQLAGHERKGDKDRRQNDARYRKDNLDVVLIQPGAQQPMGAEQQHKDHPRDHRRHRKRQVDQSDQDAFADEIELGNRPRRGHPEHDEVDAEQHQRIQE